MLKNFTRTAWKVAKTGLQTHQANRQLFLGLSTIPTFHFAENDPKKGPKGFEKWTRSVKKDSEKDKPKETVKGLEPEHKKEDEKGYKEKESEREQESKKRAQQIEEEEEKEKKEKKEEKKDEEEQEKQEDQKKSKKGLFGGLDLDSIKNFNPQKYFPQLEPKTFWSIVAASGLVASLIVAIIWYERLLKEDHISQQEFKEMIDNNTVNKIVIARQRIGIEDKFVALIYQNTDDSSRPKRLTLGNVDSFLETLEKQQLKNGKTPEGFVPVSYGNQKKVTDKLERALSVVIIGATAVLFFSLFRSVGKLAGQGKGGDLMGLNKPGFTVYGLDQKIKVKFKDVAGLDEAKLEITEFVEFLQKPKKFKEIGAQIPRGALLAGPPGTGKTLLAKAAAGEAGVPFIYVSGSDFVEMFVGVGASRVRELFKQAKKLSPSIIFIDEIDAVGRKREGKFGGNDERDSTLNQLLVEMDGFGTDTNVVVMAATNRKELLDPALTRPGRFDRSIDIDLPDIDGRKQIFLIHLKPLALDPVKTPEEYAKRLATLTPGFSGADIHNLCNEAAIVAARKNKDYVSAEDFEAATERVMAGLEKKKVLSEEERKIVAVHESGHAVVSWFLEGGNPLLKLTIIPRSKGSLGYAQYLPNESSLETKEELYDRICCILGGRCSEELFNNSVTTGAYDDLKKAYDIAYAMVAKLGMSEKVGFIGMPDPRNYKTYSDETNKLIDAEIKRIIDECTEKTRETVRKYKKQIEDLSNALLEKETLDLVQITAILGPRPYPPKSNFKAYLEIKNEDAANPETA